MREWSAQMSSVTDLLERWSGGDQEAFAELVPLVYQELRQLARYHLRHERPGCTLQATALVHEAYLRLVDQNRMEWNGRAHFFGAAAQVMRRVLVDRVRERNAQKRGDGVTPIPLDFALMVPAETPYGIIALDDALNELAKLDPERARVVEFRYFGGLSVKETAAVMEVSESTIKRDWALARAWLYRRLGGTASATPAVPDSEPEH
jgi:RNA polymerase sigma factor (TIGR02999 family)